MPDTLTADQVHAQVHDLRARAETPPVSIELGTAQLAAIEAAQREAAGTDDIGPLTQFQGLLIVKSRKPDHLKLLGPEGQVYDWGGAPAGQLGTGDTNEEKAPSGD